MPRFALRSATVEVQGQSITVWQMTAAQKMHWAAEVRKDSRVTLSLAVELCTKEDPPFTVASLADEPTDVVEALAEKVFELNGDGTPDPGEKKS